MFSLFIDVIAGLGDIEPGEECAVDNLILPRLLIISAHMLGKHVGHKTW